jgi:tetratricopeptide (TPR) repeat protein
VSSLGDLFRLQHDMARRVVDALALPLTGGPPTPTPEAPPVPHAYELYLRANALGRAYETTIEARDLYLRCVELDSGFAPAWAQLGRCYRVIGKYVDETQGSEALAEQALRRALELSPRLTVAHKYYAMLEADLGRAATAMVRLLGEADRHGNDPELFAGLVHACRYCGLLEPSIAAHHEARRLDPNISTSGQQSVLMTCDIERLLAFDGPSSVGGDTIIRVVGLGLAGRRDEARREHARLKTGLIPAFRPWNQFLLAWIDRRPAGMRAVRPELGALRIMEDPEAIFQEAWMFCDAGDHDHGLELLERAVSKGYYVAATLEVGAQFDALRDRPGFQRVLDAARTGRDAALGAFREHGGVRILGG